MFSFFFFFVNIFYFENPRYMQYVLGSFNLLLELFWIPVYSIFLILHARSNHLYGLQFSVSDVTHEIGKYLIYIVVR